MDAGLLDRLIVIERATATQNTLNEDVLTWAPLVTEWANKADVSDGEKYAAGQIGAFVMSRFTIRSNPTTRTIKATDRLIYNGTWSIHGVKEAKGGRDEFLEITAVKDADV